MSLILTLFVGLVAQAKPVPNFQFLRGQFAMGNRHMCMIAGLKLHCWGGQDWAQPPDQYREVDPTQVVAGEKHTCVLDAGEVYCRHGYDKWEAPPQFNRLREIASIGEVICGLDDDGMKCWGGDSEAAREWEMPGLKRPHLLTVGGHGGVGLYRYENSVCLVDNNKVFCRGAVGDKQIEFPRALQDPTYLNVGQSIVCVEDRLGYVCKKDSQGHIEEYPKTPLQFNAPEQIVGNAQLCALEQGKVFCQINARPGRVIEIQVPFEPLFLVGGGGYRFCAVSVDADVHCWGIRGYTDSPWRLPGDVSKMVAANGFVCVLSPAGIRCYGNDDQGIKSQPRLESPYELAAARGGVCALDAEGMKCWGQQDSFGSSGPRFPTEMIAHPKTTRFKEIAISADGIYLSTNSGELYKYLEENSKAKLVQRELQFPKGTEISSLTAGLGACFIVNEKLGCVDSPFENVAELFKPRLRKIQMRTPEDYGYQLCLEVLKPLATWCSGPGGEFMPRPIVKSDYLQPEKYISGIDPEQLFDLTSACKIERYSSHEGYFNCTQTQPWPKFIRPLVAGDCIYDQGKLNCPGHKDQDLVGPIRIQASGMSLVDLNVGLRAWAAYSSPARRLLLEDLASYIERAAPPPLERWALLKLLEPVIVSTDSAHFTENIIPAYRAMLEQIESELNPDLFAKNGDQARAALRVAASTLKVLAELLAVDKQTEIADSLRLISRAMIKLDGQDIDRALMALDAIDTSKFNSPKTEFLVQTLRLSTEKLRVSR